MTRCHTNYETYPIYTTVLTGKNIPPHIGYRPRIPQSIMNLLANPPRPETPAGTIKQKIIQTMFRESEAQTDPYVVDVAEETNKGLEILTLGWLSWNHGLPAGMHEIQTIERARQRRAWESALPYPLDSMSKEIRRIVIEAIELNEWRYREEVMIAMSSLRAELAKKLLREKYKEAQIKYETRMNQYARVKRDERAMKIQKLRINFNRQIRKLISHKRKENHKYHRWDIIKQFTDKTSELYAPQLRFGEDPRHWHEKLPPKCSLWRAFQKLEIMHHTVADIPVVLLPAFDFNSKSKPHRQEFELCIRSTKWTEQKLEHLHELLRQLRWKRHTTPRPCFLKKKVRAYGNEFEIPAVSGVSDEEEEMYQACLFLQKTIKGRAIQAVIFEGRVKCQELLEELKSTHALQNNTEDLKGEHMRKVYGLQRQAEIDRIQEKKKNEILCALEGKTIGDMLDFLSKELLRLQDERKTHALALLADQERHKREAAEAGRRQLEEQRRREHEEMYKQIVKLHQNVVHSFLDDTFIENTEWIAHREAREYTTDLAKKVDQAALESSMQPLFTRSDDLQEEEIIADLIHNFALPEAEKRIVRKRLNDRQRNYLKICHDEVYSNIETVVKGLRTSSGTLIPLPRVGKHRIPPQVRVKYRQLKRMHESSSSSVDSKNSQNSTTSALNEQFFPQLVTESKLKEKNQSSDKVWSSGFSRQEVIIADMD